MFCEVRFGLKCKDMTSCVLVLAILLWIYGAGNTLCFSIEPSQIQWILTYAGCSQVSEIKVRPV